MSRTPSRLAALALNQPWGVACVAVILALVTGLAYSNSFSGPFVFDDLPSIPGNLTIRDLGRPGEILGPQARAGLPVSGRPVVNLSFALNYAISGSATWSYHVGNVLVHVAAGCLLFGIVRRTLQAAPLRGRHQEHATVLAAIVAALWLLHPLQTESVTYVVQRAESLCGLFYLAAVYAFIRGVTGERSLGWLGVAAMACWCGMATKEVMATAPLVLLLYDRTFLAGNFRVAWQRRGKFYVVLGASWLLLVALVVSTSGRGGTAGFGTAVSPWSYALTQCRAVVLYLRLAAWPSPLVFDYGITTVRSFSEIWLHALVLAGLLAATAIALVRRPVLGFAGACFFLLLAPTSSVVPVATQTMAEHRVYLALAPLVTATAAGIVAWGGARGLVVLAGLGLVLGVITHRRNYDYRSALVLWGDTAAKFPGNARAHNNLGQALFDSGQVEASIASYQRALAIQPDFPEPLYNQGVSLAHLGKLAEAIPFYEQALRLKPTYPEAENNLGAALVQLDQVPAAISHYERALRQRPDYAEAQHNLGDALLQVNRVGNARISFQRALALKPDYAEAHYGLGNALASGGKMAEALVEYRAALRLKPDYVEAQVNAGNALLQLDRPAEAVLEYQAAIRRSPGFVDAHYNLGNALLLLDRGPEAIAAFEATLRLEPGHANAHRGLGFALGKAGRIDEAIVHYEAVLRALPDDRGVRDELAALRSRR